jgi:hypothetical protein
MPLGLAFIADHAGFSYAFTFLGGIMMVCLPFFFRLRLEEE